MDINTARFGKLIAGTKNSLNFVSPILGFDDFRSYIALSEDQGPFDFIQSLDDEHLTFILTDPYLFFSEYDFALDQKWLDLLRIEREEQVVVRSIVTVRSPSDISINLRAPVIINSETLKAAQVVLDRSDYTQRFPIMKPKGQEEFNADSVEK